MGQEKEPCIRFTQENSLLDCLPYILNPYGLCYYYFRPCVYLEVNICYTCCIISSFQNLLLSSIATLWPVTCDSVTVMSHQKKKPPNPSSQKRKEKKKKIKRKVKRNLDPNFINLTCNMLFLRICLLPLILTTTTNTPLYSFEIDKRSYEI